MYRPELKPKEHFFQLYAHHIDEGAPLANTRRIGHNNWAINWTVFDGPNRDAKLVARLQGIYYDGGNSSVDLVFTDERFPSTLKFAGYMENENEMDIVGGTGTFALAQGIVKHSAFQPSGPRMREFRIRAMVPTLGKTVPLTMDGPWGGTSGIEYNVEHLPLNLGSVTIRSGDFVDSLAFSYTDQSRNKRTLGPWGGPRGTENKISLAPMETVTKMAGTTTDIDGNIVVTSISFATNLEIYGPYGVEQGNEFNTATGDNIIVGFYARAGHLVNSIGVYTRKKE